MPRGEASACTVHPGPRQLRADGARYCPACKLAAQHRRRERARWERAYAVYLLGCQRLGVAEVHYRLRQELGLTLRRGHR